jgi:hypothetical protein
MNTTINHLKEKCKKKILINKGHNLYISLEKILLEKP